MKNLKLLLITSLAIGAMVGCNGGGGSSSGGSSSDNGGGGSGPAVTGGLDFSATDLIINDADIGTLEGINQTGVAVGYHGYEVLKVVNNTGYDVTKFSYTNQLGLPLGNSYFITNMYSDCHKLINNTLNKGDTCYLVVNYKPPYQGMSGVDALSVSGYANGQQVGASLNVPFKSQINAGVSPTQMPAVPTADVVSSEFTLGKRINGTDTIQYTLVNNTRSDLYAVTVMPHANGTDQYNAATNPYQVLNTSSGLSSTCLWAKSNNTLYAPANENFALYNSRITLPAGGSCTITMNKNATNKVTNLFVNAVDLSGNLYTTPTVAVQ